MNEDEYRELVQFIQSQFREIGLSDLADLRNYLTSIDAEASLPESKKLVHLMLEAFDRHLAALDAQTVTESLVRIRKFLADGPVPELAVVHYPEALSELTRTKSPVLISGYSGIADIRTQLREFMDDLDREPPTPDRSRGFER